MAELEYTIEIGWDAHTHAGYASFVASSPEEALALRGDRFHPDTDSVVRREVGTEEWSYVREDQKFDYAEKLTEYREARKKEEALSEIYRPKKSSALPRNRRVQTSGRSVKPGDRMLWYSVRGEFDLDRIIAEADASESWPKEQSHDS